MKLKIGLDGFTLDREVAEDVVAIVGRRGRGKTTTAVVIVEELHRTGGRFCVADPTGAWWGLKSSKSGKAPGLQVVVMGGDHGDVPLTDTAGRFVADFVADSSNPSVVLDFFHFRKAAMVRFMGDFLEELYHKNREQLWLVLDEAEQFAPQQIRQRQGEGAVPKMLGAMEDVVKLGRVRGLFPLLITQRCASLNKNVLELAGTLIAHGLTGPNDKAAVDKWVKDNATEEQRSEFHRTLAGLPRGTAWFWQPEAEIFRKVQVRDRRTFDSSATPARGVKSTAPKVVAKLDLDALKKSMASTIEKAKANDPKELRKRVSALERELAAKKPETKVVEIPVVKEAELKRLEKLADRASAAVASFTENIEKLLSDVQRRSRAPSPAIAEPQRPSVSAEIMKPRRVRSPRSVDSDNDAQLGKGEALVLTAIAQHPDGVTRKQITVLTSYKRSTRDTYLQRLSVRGFVDSQGDRVLATDPGFAALGSDFTPLPTGDELREYWHGKLPAGERTVFEEIARAYPDSIRRDDLNIEFKRSTRDTYIQRLESRQLVKAMGRGEVRASEMLFS